ncbi:hypothetical protein HBI67_016140 [Parastagonospora nodorum]|nr:hypothetical protein HBI28_215890 [Parastagonospora nodorum]KAH5618658.1 hypothetical protein HBI22_233240 [Parastagonospora nodorum]KAH6084626.1 hypothetical protein HBI66_051970 [Parastagonospora nodorum]KAH6086604.1 hypothetical protein HBI67_016140 [Parastagonospora nodorum]
MRANAIQTVHYLVRAKDDQDAQRRVQESLQQRKIYNSLSPAARQKTHALPSDLPDPQLGLHSKTYQPVTKNLVIHCPWSFNFNLSLSSFEKDCITGVRHLIDLSLAVPGSKPASFNFCSSPSLTGRKIWDKRRASVWQSTYAWPLPRLLVCEREFFAWVKS